MLEIWAGMLRIALPVAVAAADTFDGKACTAEMAEVNPDATDVPNREAADCAVESPDEAAVLHKLRRVLSGLDSHQAIDLVIDRLKKSRNNLEFLMQVSKTTPGAIDE